MRTPSTRFLVLTLLAALPCSTRAGAQLPAAASTTPSTATSPAPAPAANLPIVFSGEMRTRSELDHPGGALSSDLFTYLRTRFGARIDAAPGVRLLLQMQDSRVLGAGEGGVSQQFDLHQAYAELSRPLRGVRVALRAGRQEIALGNERLVGAVGWSNTGRSFDGARVMAAPADAKSGAERWTATLFAATVEERGRHFGVPAADSKTSPDHAVAGLFATRLLPRNVVLAGTLLHDAGGHYRSYGSADRTTLDARVRVPRLRVLPSALLPDAVLAFELEAAVQRGRQQDIDDSTSTHRQDVQAWMAAVRIGTSNAPARRAAITLGADVLSGDASPHDAHYGGFSTMYGSNHAFYGVMDLVGDPASTTRERGLLDLLATSNVTLARAVALRAELHRFSFASGSGREMGWEADVAVPIRVGANATLDAGYSVFRNGAHASAIGLGARGATRDWAFAQLRVGF